MHYLITSEKYWLKEATPKSLLQVNRKAALQCINEERELAKSVVTCPEGAKIRTPNITYAGR
jgi:hypothetical protein